MVLTLMGLRARTPETTAALSTVAQGWGYLLAGGGPLLVGILRGATGGYTGMFALVLAGVAGLTVTGWLVTRERYVDDEIPGPSSTRPRPEVVTVAGTEPPATAPGATAASVRTAAPPSADGGSPRA
jgi:CP family cyanate transporter-like MFS transporter